MVGGTTNVSSYFLITLRCGCLNVMGWFAEDPAYPFFKYDYMTKHSLRVYAARCTVRCGDLQERLSADKVIKEGSKGI